MKKNAIAKVSLRDALTCVGNCVLTRLCITMSVVAEVAHARDTEAATNQQVDFLCLLTVRFDWSSVHMSREWCERVGVSLSGYVSR